MQFNALSQLYHEYKLQIDEATDTSKKDYISNEFKTKFIQKFDEFEPTDMIKLCYEYFSNIISDFNEKKNFFDYNLLMFEIISSKLVRKPRILDAWFQPNLENKRKLIKLLGQTQKEILLCSIHLKNKEIIDSLINLTDKNIISIKIIIDQNTEFRNQFITHGIKIKFLKDQKEQIADNYIIIDKRILINGILSWDSQETNLVSKQMLLIENESLSRAFCQNFDNLWKKIEDSEINEQNQSSFPLKINLQEIEVQPVIFKESKPNGLKIEKVTKKYKKVNIKKFRRIMKKIKKKTRSNFRNSRIINKMRQIKEKEGVLSNIFGFMKKIFR